MIPPVHRVTPVAVQRGVGTPGWKAYRSVLRQTHATFAGNYEMLEAARNEARKVFWLRRHVSGEDLQQCVKDAEQAVFDMQNHVGAVYDDGKGGNRLILTAEQAKANAEGVQFYSASDLEAETKKNDENIERALKGQRIRTYKAKVKCM
ncbi:hypothetical protein DIPPA_23343 [Diplonema papillatum]|nr:hypothetical protein DIPPA_23343 [Diplonema papillatum]